MVSGTSPSLVCQTRNFPSSLGHRSFGLSCLILSCWSCEAHKRMHSGNIIRSPIGMSFWRVPEVLLVGCLPSAAPRLEPRGRSRGPESSRAAARGPRRPEREARVGPKAMQKEGGRERTRRTREMGGEVGGASSLFFASWASQGGVGSGPRLDGGRDASQDGVRSGFRLTLRGNR